MYRNAHLIAITTLVCISFVIPCFAQASNSSKSPKVKIRRACTSLRLLARENPGIRTRAKVALFKKREAEKLCRDGFTTLLPGVQPKAVGGSICKGLAKHRNERPDIMKVLSEAKRIDRQADMRCARILRRLHPKSHNPKLGGGK